MLKFILFYLNGIEKKAQTNKKISFSNQFGWNTAFDIFVDAITNKYLEMKANI